MKPKKSLGQNFLKDESVLNKIIEAADLKSDDFILEIGPGTGILTDRLAEKSGKVLAVEKDDALAKNLKNNFKQAENIEIIHGDIMGINLPEILEKNGAADKDYKLVANIPYYITSPIIQLFLETKYPPNEMILMVQKEVAERICSGPGEMSILSTSVQYYAAPEILFYVDKESFWPVPEVDSAVIKISTDKSAIKKLSREETKKFFRIVKAGFSAKRKTLVNNLSSSLQITKEEVENKLEKLNLTSNVRAQELSVDDWKKLSLLF